MDAVINTQNVLAQEFFGKDILLELLSKNLLSEYEERREDCTVLRERQERYCRREKPTTPHKASVCEGAKYLAERLNGDDGKVCVIRDYYVAPYYVYCVYFLEASGVIFKCAKAYDVSKTPKDVWEEAWGKQPESLPTLEELIEKAKREARERGEKA